MVLVAFEMLDERMAEYLANMDIYDREIMVLDRAIIDLFKIMEAENART